MSFTFGAVAPQPQQQQQPTLFGSQPQQQQPSLFGTQPQQQQPSLFGSQQPQQQQPAGLFGSPLVATPAPVPNFGGGTGITGGTGGIPPAGTGFSFGAAASMSSVPTLSNVPTSTPSVLPTSVPSISGGLGGIPSTGRIATLALGADPWQSRVDNRALKELMVPPEIVAAVEDLKNQMRKERTTMSEVQRVNDLEIDTVGEQIDDVRATLNSLGILMHKQEVHSASLVADLREIEKDMHTLAQVREGTGNDNDSLSMPVNFLCNLAEKYSNRLNLYKLEFERAEFSLKCMVGVQTPNAQDLWTALTATKDAIILLSSQLQQLQEDLRHQLATHKTICQVVYGTTPKPWLMNAIAGSLESKSTPPLEKIWQTPTATQSSSNASLLGWPTPTAPPSSSTTGVKVWPTTPTAPSSSSQPGLKAWQTPTASPSSSNTSTQVLFKRPALN